MRYSSKSISFFNDLANKANSNHTHSNYVTSDQVSTIVNNSIQNGEISMSSSPFKSLKVVTTSSSSGTTISGKGIVSIPKDNDNNSRITIDGSYTVSELIRGEIFLFSNKVNVWSDNKFSTTTVIVGVFN